MMKRRRAPLIAAVVGAVISGCAGGQITSESDDCVRGPGCAPEDPCCDEKTLCAVQVCDGIGYVCGVDEQGAWAWLEEGPVVSCDDDDTCTQNDTCVNGECLGVSQPCTDPPPTECVDGSTLRSYSSAGSCIQGACSYPTVDTLCPQGCSGGLCIGESCLGVQCDKPPTSCHVSPGTCVAGDCSYAQAPAGERCDTGDPCQVDGVCDSQGSCSGTPVSCSAPNAGGTCVNGVCAYSCTGGYGNCNDDWDDGCEADLTTVSHCGSCTTSCTTGGNATASCIGGSCSYLCTSGYGNCNNDWGDGCETSLSTTSNCGSCGVSCSGAANATAVCQSGSCKLSCKTPYQDCDGKASNGCEIPVGVPNRCDKTGLNSANGCGTAYCGTSGQADAVNFATWTCTFCSHCHHYPDGYAWCLFNSSGQFSSDRCSTCCNDSLADLVCPK